MMWHLFFREAFIVVLSIGAIALLLFFNARRMALAAEKRQKVTAYIIEENQLVILRGEQEQRQEWVDIKKLRVVRGSLVFYCASRRAYLLPLRDLQALNGPALARVLEVLRNAFGKSMPRLRV